MTTNKKITTYSMWQMFSDCRKAYEFRYVKQIIPTTENQNLTFGSIIHKCLEIWHQKNELAQVINYLSKTYELNIADEKQLAKWQLALAMMIGYVQHYPDDDLQIIGLEQLFQHPIKNPTTGRKSRKFILAGKIDGIIKKEENFYILEHKTTSSLNQGYLERLSMDFQTYLYALAAQESLGYPITGIIYNIICKSQIRQTKKETQDEFRDRLAEKYKDPMMYHRQTIVVLPDRLEKLMYQLWELSYALCDATKRNKYYRNISHCYKYNTLCQYFPICRSDENPLIISNLYKHEPPHQELHNITQGEINVAN